jgi:hypothetical protein
MFLVKPEEHFKRAVDRFEVRVCLPHGLPLSVVWGSVSICEECNSILARVDFQRNQPIGGSGRTGCVRIWGDDSTLSLSKGAAPAANLCKPASFDGLRMLASKFPPKIERTRRTNGLDEAGTIYYNSGLIYQQKQLG